MTAPKHINPKRCHIKLSFLFLSKVYKLNSESLGNGSHIIWQMSRKEKMRHKSKEERTKLQNEAMWSAGQFKTHQHQRQHRVKSMCVNLKLHLEPADWYKHSLPGAHALESCHRLSQTVVNIPVQEVYLGWGVMGNNFIPVNLVVARLGSQHHHPWMEEGWGRFLCVERNPTWSPHFPKALNPLWLKEEHSSSAMHNCSQTAFCARRGRTAIRQSWDSELARTDGVNLTLCLFANKYLYFQLNFIQVLILELQPIWFQMPLTGSVCEGHTSQSSQVSFSEFLTPGL
jgi:hypothetical protein